MSNMPYYPTTIDGVNQGFAGSMSFAPRLCRTLAAIEAHAGSNGVIVNFLRPL
jgi:hypothetical protein